MLRALVRARPSWPGISGRSAILPPRVAATAVVTAQKNALPACHRCHPFHSTASSSIGFKNFKSSPRVKWRTQQELDAKNAKVIAARQPNVTYAEALKSHAPRAWIGARKKVVWGRLFGPSNSSSSSNSNSEREQSH
ncbi:unnamed protein product [Pylaiella littoralis]